MKLYDARLPILALALAALFLAACAAKPAASSDDPSGKWSGDYGSSPSRRDPVSLDLKWADGKLDGTVHAGPRSLPITNGSYKPETGAISLDFDTQGNNGQTVHYRIEGKVDGGTMTGKWTHDGERGDFRLTKE